MRAFIQRSLSAHVSVDDQIVGQISHGLVVLLGIGREDTLEKGKKLIDKLLKYRIFDDENGKMGWNVAQANGGILLISQFTLYANTHKGLRPDFAPAMPPAEAEALYDALLSYLHSQYQHVAAGIFAADMQVHLINDGPVSFMLEV
ncbi:D-tyrosyl-tRNA(Tyr) deacylase [Acinetobacter marinus]|uniref:D-aminoacyl-tRNA deacylase n=1 Tax=Acinetobacter marinus TaxID=281375 RepID=A0A1G6NXK1_9GAMM|nr:D-aminoacyl-tRNA deacylase [Acinetobacter marinus]SDC71976.1 D-tyrosyl-tRNA(Tyr) deacylase [Acinetobacter marinus]